MLTVALRCRRPSGPLLIPRVVIPLILLLLLALRWHLLLLLLLHSRRLPSQLSSAYRTRLMALIAAVVAIADSGGFGRRDILLCVAIGLMLLLVRLSIPLIVTLAIELVI